MFSPWHLAALCEETRITSNKNHSEQSITNKPLKTVGNILYNSSVPKVKRGSASLEKAEKLEIKKIKLVLNDIGHEKEHEKKIKEKLRGEQKQKHIMQEENEIPKR